MEFPDIRLLVPHSGQMVLLDQVVAADNQSLTAQTTIRSDSLFYNGKGVDAWVGVEYMAQTIAAYAGYMAHLNNQPVKLGFLLGTRRYECLCPIFESGSTLLIQVQHIFQADNGLASFECSIDEQGTCLATATLTVFQPENADDFLMHNNLAVK